MVILYYRSCVLFPAFRQHLKLQRKCVLRNSSTREVLAFSLFLLACYQDMLCLIALLLLVVDTWWQSPAGPIFFYCGNEGPIDTAPDSVGFIRDIAPQFKALLIYAEHVCLRSFLLVFKIC